MSLFVTVPSTALLEAIGTLDDVEFALWDVTSPPPAERIDIVVPPYMGTIDYSAIEDISVGLVQGQMIGFDGVEAALPAGNVFANASSVHETSTAELAMALALASQRAIPDFVRAASAGSWSPQPTPSFADRRVMILGYGGVGKALEARLAGFEVDITRVASHARDTDAGRVHGIDELPSLLPETEIVFVIVPLTESTTGLIDDAFLTALPDNALVVNIARGKVADTDAVLAHADRLRFALDVTDPEPLPDGHPLFAHPRVLISPHVGGVTSAMMPRMAALVRRQAERMLAGEEPLNVKVRSSFTIPGSSNRPMER